VKVQKRKSLSPYIVIEILPGPNGKFTRTISPELSRLDAGARGYGPFRDDLEKIRGGFSPDPRLSRAGLERAYRLHVLKELLAWGKENSTPEIVLEVGD
jgi:hypothetical protein